MKYYVGSHIIENIDQDTVWIQQPKLLEHLEHKFKDAITSETIYKMPVGTKIVIMNPDKYDPLISTKDQDKYGSKVRTLLCLFTN
jgi:hypothetical protein